MEYADSLWAHLGGDADVDVTTEAEVDRWLEMLLDEAEEDNLETAGVDGEPYVETTWNSAARTITRREAILRRTASGEPEWIEAARRIVANKQYETVDGVLFDAFSASAVLQVYEALSDENKEKYGAMSLPKAVDVAFKLINRTSRRQAMRKRAQEYKSLAAQQAAASGYGGESYWAYLDEIAQEHYDFWMARGDTAKAEAQFTQSLSEALQRPEGYNEASRRRLATEAPGDTEDTEELYDDWSHLDDGDSGFYGESDETRAWRMAEEGRESDIDEGDSLAFEDDWAHEAAAKDDDELIDWQKRKSDEDEGLVDWGGVKPQTYQRELKTRSQRHIAFDRPNVTSAQEARDAAVDWQYWVSGQNLSYGEMADWQAFFAELAERFPELAEEFAENGII